MPVTEVKGNIFDTDCEVITIPVNTVGRMGKGLALEARNRCPMLYKAYQYLCNNRTIKVTQPALVNIEGQMYLLFPTKEHFRDPSEYHWVQNNLNWIIKEHTVHLRGIKSIALPPLGCGLGGLNWDDVRSMIHDTFRDHPIEITLYVPHVDKLPVPTEW